MSAHSGVVSPVHLRSPFGQCIWLASLHASGRGFILALSSASDVGNDTDRTVGTRVAAHIDAGVDNLLYRPARHRGLSVCRNSRQARDLEADGADSVSKQPRVLVSISRPVHFSQN